MWKTFNPIWQTLILIFLIAGAVPTIYFCGYKSSAKKAEAEKAEVIATYQASALVAEQLYTEKLKAANEEKQRWFDFAQAQSRDLATAYQQIGRQAAQLEKQIDETVQKTATVLTALALTACNSTTVPSATIKTVTVAEIPPVSSELLLVHERPERLSGGSPEQLLNHAVRYGEYCQKLEKQISGWQTWYKKGRLKND